MQPLKECHSGLLFKFKSIGVGGSVLYICTEFLSNRRQRLVVDGAVSEWVPIIQSCHRKVCWVLIFFYHIYTWLHQSPAP